jgi:hypothetical protein
VERRVSLSANVHTPSLIIELVLQRVAGKDASKQFWKYHNEGILKKYKAQLQIGSLDTKKQAAPPTPPATPPAKKEKAKPRAESGAVSTQPEERPEPLDQYGDLIPFADPSWYQNVRLRPPKAPPLVFGLALLTDF